jgi:beta-phosphoglucomutase-like phosphatase (HAD superfamily)
MKQVSFKGKKVIIFDLDGTIVKLSADWKSLKDSLLSLYNERYNEDCNFKRVSTCLDQVVQKKDEATLQDFFDFIREFELKNIEDTQIIEETIYFINHKELFGVNKKAKFAILSLNTRSTIKRALEIAKISDKINFIVGREDVRRWKPAPDGIIKIQKYYNLAKNQMIFFGDLKNDILTGRNSGIDVYYIDDLIDLVKKKNG